MFFSLKGYYSFITSRELAWGTMTRQGFEGDKKDENAENNSNNDNNTPNDSNNLGGQQKQKRPSILDRLKEKKVSSEVEQIKT
jgi:hypothetical protein